MLSKRLKIINNTYEYLSINGLKDLTMNPLLKYLNMSKGSFYHYFKSKDELISNLFFTILDVHIIENKSKIEDSNSLREKLEILYNLYLVDTEENKIFIDLYKDFLLTYGNNDNEFVNLYNKKYKDIFSKVLYKIIQKEIKNGVIKEDSLSTINIVMTTADGMMMYSSSFEEFDLSKEFSIFLDFYIESIKI